MGGSRWPMWRIRSGVTPGSVSARRHCFMGVTTGLRNCVELIGSAAACYNLVWADGDQLTMTLANQQFAGVTPAE